MLKIYLNQTATLERRTGIDERGQATFAPYEEIACRRMRKALTAFSPTDELYSRQTIYYTTTPVSAGDKLDGESVLGVYDWVGLGGRITGYKAVL